MAYNFNTQPQYQQQQAANNNMPQFQQQNIQPLFPQPQGNVYNINSTLEVAIAQDIPEATTINANVVITIGTGTATYPLVNCNCTNVNACQITSKRRYSTKVFTNIQNGVFKLLGPVNCFNCKHSGSLPITTTTETTG